MSKLGNIIRNITKRVKAFFGGRPKQKTLHMPSGAFKTKERERGKDRGDRWISRPALCRWQNIPVKAVNTHFNAKWHQAMREAPGVGEVTTP